MSERSEDASVNGKKSEPISLKEELAEFKEAMGSTATDDQGEDLSVELMDLKRRMDAMEKEMKSVSRSLKSTLMDIRSMISDLDNPFNLLRSMGIDNLVQKAIRQVEEEVEKARREEAKKRLAKMGMEEPKEKVIAIQTQPDKATVKLTPVETTDSERPASHVGAVEVKDTFSRASAQTFPGKPPDTIKIPIPRSRRLVEEKTSTVRIPYGHIPPSFIGLDYYEIYTTILSGLLVLNLGEEGALKLINEYVLKGVTSPKVAKDLIDHIKMMKVHDSSFQNKPRLTYFNLDLEDYMLIMRLLKKMSTGDLRLDEHTHLLLLLSLLKALSYLVALNQDREPNS